MADVKKCDRCGGIYSNAEKEFKNNGRLLTHIELWEYGDCRIARYDLCDECCEKLYKFLNMEEDNAVECDDCPCWEKCASKNILGTCKDWPDILRRYKED